MLDLSRAYPVIFGLPYKGLGNHLNVEHLAVLRLCATPTIRYSPEIGPCAVVSTEDERDIDHTVVFNDRCWKVRIDKKNMSLRDMYLMVEGS